MEKLKLQVEADEIMKKMEAILKNDLNKVTSHYEKILKTAKPGVDYKRIILKRNAEIEQIKSPSNRKIIIDSYHKETANKKKLKNSPRSKKYCIHCSKTYTSETCPNCFNS